MITPKWLNTKCQPIAISNVIQVLLRAMNNRNTFNRNFDIGGPDILSYKEILLGYAKERGLIRKIITVPIMTPRLSSYWLFFITSTSYRLAKALVDSMKIEVICRPSGINEILNLNPLSYSESIKRTIQKIESNQIVSSWKDALASGRLNIYISDFLNVPTFGCYSDQRIAEISNSENTRERIWQLGGAKGWLYANFLWKIRGFIDRIIGGVGLRRGRTNQNTLEAGDALDFWRVLYSNKEEGRLLLFAEMKLPGEAWLEFRIRENQLYQTATFRPKGLLGRFYWWLVYPFHGIIFRGLIKKLTK